MFRKLFRELGNLALMPHQNFPSGSNWEIAGIMLRNRCWPTTFHTVAAEDADGWCLNWPVWSPIHIDAPITPNFSSGSSCEIAKDYVEK